MASHSRRQERNRAALPVRCRGVLLPDRRRSQGFRSRPATSRKKKSRRWGASSSSPLRRRSSRCQLRAEGDAGEGRAGGRLHRQRHRRIRSDRARAPDPAGTWAAAHLAVFHSGHHHQSGLRVRFHPQRRQRARIRPRPRPAPPARIRSAIRSASFSAATPMP